MSDSDAEIKFGATTDDVAEGVKQIREQLATLNESVNGVGESAKKLAEAFGIAFSIEGVKTFIEAMGNLALQTERTMAMLGITSQQVGVFGGLAQLTGTSVEGMTNGIERLSLNIQKSTRDGFNPAAQGLKALGLSAKDLIGVPADQYLTKLADAVSKFNPSLNLTNALMAVGGRGIAQMLPLLMQGGEGFERLSAAVKETGATLTDAQTKAFAGMHQSVTLLGMSFTGLGIKIMDYLRPAIVAAADGLRKLIESIDSKAIGDALSAVGNTAISVAESIALFFVDAKASWDTFIAAINAGMPVLHAAAGGALLLAGQGGAALEQFKEALAGVGKADSFAAIEAGAQASRDKINAMATAARDALKAMAAGSAGMAASEGSSGPKKDMGAMNFGAAGDAAAAMKDMEAQIKVVEQGHAQKKALYEGEAKTFQITEDKKFALLEDATEKAYQTELGLLWKEYEIGDLSVAQKAAVLAKISELTAKHRTEMMKLDEQSLEAQAKQWEAYFTTIEGAFNSQLRGLLAGTENFGTAFKKIIGDMVIKFVEGVEKMAGDWAAVQIAMSAATTAGAAARATADAAGNSTWLASLIASARSSIGASAGQTSAEVTAKVAPALGPAAPAAGAAAGASTMASALAFLVPHEVGSWEVPAITPALLHPGEMVIPQSFAEGLRGNGGLGGGDTNTVNINAVDAQSITNLFQSNSAVIGQIMQKYVKSNPRVARGM